MILTYGDVILRAIEEKDENILLEMINSIDIETMTVDSHFPISSIVQKDWVRNYRNTEQCVRLMIELVNGITVGMIILSEINYKNRTASLAFKKFAKKGATTYDSMKNACIALLNYAFNELGLNCITTRTLPFNEKSLNLQARLGFVREGVLRQRCFKNGKFQDLISSSLLRSDFLKLLNTKGDLQ